MNANGSLTLTPIAVDGRQLLSEPCNGDNAVYTRYNQTELMKVSRTQMRTQGNPCPHLMSAGVRTAQDAECSMKDNPALASPRNPKQRSRTNREGFLSNTPSALTLTTTSRASTSTSSTARPCSPCTKSTTRRKCCPPPRSTQSPAPPHPRPQRLSPRRSAMRSEVPSRQGGKCR